MALVAEIPDEDLTYDESRKMWFYAGMDTERAYRPLCRSHHAREGVMRAAMRIVVTALADHPDCVERVRKAMEAR